MNIDYLDYWLKDIRLTLGEKDSTEMKRSLKALLVPIPVMTVALSASSSHYVALICLLGLLVHRLLPSVGILLLRIHLPPH